MKGNKKKNIKRTTKMETIENSVVNVSNKLSNI